MHHILSYNITFLLGYCCCIGRLLIIFAVLLKFQLGKMMTDSGSGSGAAAVAAVGGAGGVAVGMEAKPRTRAARPGAFTDFYNVRDGRDAVGRGVCHQLPRFVP